MPCRCPCIPDRPIEVLPRIGERYYYAAWSRDRSSILAIIIFSRRPSRVTASDPAAYPTSRGRYRVEHRAGTSVLPDVHHVRPLDLRIYTHFLQGHWLVYAEVGGQGLQNMGPDPFLLRRADYPEAHLVD